MDTPFAITLDVGSSLANKTGSWRTERPVYVRNQAPCAGACPAGEDPQAWLYWAEEGDYERAWREIMAVNPLPAVMGRVCYHPCETACNRCRLDEAVGINSVERFLGDHAIASGWTVAVDAPPSGKRVLVVGAGPSGLAAAYHLALLGHAVEIHESAAKPGGMMRYGIPRYRLPRDVLDAEIERILSLGVTLRCDRRVEDLEGTLRDGAFDAAFVAVGAHLGKRAYIPAGSAARMLDAVALLRGMEGAGAPQLGRRVAVYGGGNTAFDAARTAKRLGAEEAVVVYRRTQDRMPAHDSELQEALEEGVLVKWLSTIRSADEGRLVLEKMALDESGFPVGTGEYEELEADALVLALGQDSDLSLLERCDGVAIADGVVQVAEDLMTGHPGVFAGGDIVPAERTVTAAIGHGRTAAHAIDAYLATCSSVPTHPRVSTLPHVSTLDGGAAAAGGAVPTGVSTLDGGATTAGGAASTGVATPPYVVATPPHVASYEALNTWYYDDAPRSVRPKLEAARRTSTFDEVVGGLDASTALFEARRCLSCGSCFACDNCYGVCPDNAVIKLGASEAYAYAFDLDYCKGCGLCVEECPCGAIELVPEPI